MNHTNYSHGMNRTAVSPELAGKESGAGVSHTLAGHGTAWEADTAGTDDTGAALNRVTAGIREGASPLQFMDSINTGSRQLGNRAFLHRVGQLHADRAAAQVVLRGESVQPLSDRVTAGLTQVKAASVCAAAPVQMQGKKDKKNKNNKPEDEDGHDLPALEAVSLELINPVENPDLLATADSGMEIQQVEAALENEVSGIVDDIPDSGSDFEDDADEFMASHFPVILSKERSSPFERQVIMNIYLWLS